MLHQIGVGALGPVFRTYEPDRDRLVAVKVFRLDITPETAAALADALSHAAEAGLFHPSIVEPIAAGLEGSLAYHAEEYVAAESLDASMRRFAPAPLDSVLPLVTQLAGAIDFARAAGIGHGALHPRDIFVVDDEVRATGFGVVESLEGVGLRAPVRRPYSAPERIAGRPWSTEADVFSLAVVTYELLTGRRPAGLGPEIGPLTAGLPDARLDALHKVLARAMDEDPARRFSTALAFASALEAAARGETSAAAGEPAAAAAAAAVAAAAAPPPVPPRDPLREHSDRAATLAFDPGDAPSDFQGEDDIAVERDEDEAHHEMTALELNEAEHESEPEMDEDSAAEAEADRYAADDFLIGVAGAASAPRELGSLDEFSQREPVIDRRALEDDEVMVDEPYSPVAAAGGLERGEADERPVSAPGILGLQEDVPERRRRVPVLLMFVVGVAAGIAAGYALWGRSSTAPAAREYSEAAVAPPSAERPAGSSGGPAAGSTARPSSSAATDAPASQPASRPESGPAAAVRSDAGAPRSGTAPADAPASSARRGASPPAPAASAPARAAARTGTLVVRSTPSGAGVTLNGRWRGRTPLTLEELPFARYDVRVVQPGFTTARDAVQLSAAAPERSLSFRLQEQAKRQPRQGARPAASSAAPVPERPGSYTGSVFVDSRPRGARVFIDGKPVGVTPVSVPDIGIGSHVVRLELPDHRIWSSATRVVSGETSRVTGSLERIQ